MERRYQVFLSSTYEDLKSERAETIQALLELNCMPSGMELFPAANETQWKWIKQVIDESDYYLVILGGRYGTVHQEKDISYTEMEYRYALSTGKPVLAFLHDDPSSIPVSKSEKVQKNKKKLNDFRALCEKQLCNYWSTPHDLAAKVSRSLIQLMRREPAVGWIKADQISTEQRDMLSLLRQENLELKEKLSKHAPVVDTEDLASGDDGVYVDFAFLIKKVKLDKANRRQWESAPDLWKTIEFSWNKLLYLAAPALNAGKDEQAIYKILNAHVLDKIKKADLELGDDYRLEGVVISTESAEQIKMQLSFLGLIEIDDDYWYLTDLGKAKIVELRGVKPGEKKPSFEL